MQLPENLQHFPHATLIVAADTVHANLYLLGGDSLEHIESVVMLRDNQNNPDDASKGFNDTQKSGLESDISDEARLTHYTKEVVEKIDSLVREHGIATVHLVMPTEISNRITAILPGDVRDSIGKKIDLDLMKSTPLEIVERVVETE